MDVADLAALSTWVYLVIVAVAAGDAVLPVLPSETIVILAAVLAAQGDLNAWVIAGAAALGAAIGDTTSYLIGRTARRGREPRFEGRFGRAVAWANGLLRRRGPTVLVVARFVPGGRTAATFTSGYVGLPIGSFAAAIALGATLWAAHATVIGYIGGRVFHDRILLGMGLGLLLGVLSGVGIELARSRMARGTLRP